MTKFNTNISDINTPNVECLLHEQGGLYSVTKPLTLNDFIRCAKHLIASQYTASMEITSSQESRDYFVTALAMHEEEKFMVMFLNNKNQVIALETLFSGTINAAHVYPRVLIKRALAHNAAAVILGHNHPSGYAVASKADIELTKELKRLLALLDIKVLDHIIVAGAKSISMEEEGRL